MELPRPRLRQFAGGAAAFVGNETSRDWCEVSQSCHTKYAGCYELTAIFPTLDTQNRAKERVRSYEARRDIETHHRLRVELRGSVAPKLTGPRRGAG